MSRRLIGLGIVLVGVLIFFGVRQFYIHIQADYWDSQKQLVSQASQVYDLKSITQVEYFYGEKTIGIVYGQDRQAHDVIVLMDGDKLLKAFRLDQIAAIDVLKENIESRIPGAEVLRVTPGIREREYVWEFYLKQMKDKKANYYFLYYDLQQGTYIDTYVLTPKLVK